MGFSNIFTRFVTGAREKDARSGKSFYKIYRLRIRNYFGIFAENPNITDPMRKTTLLLLILLAGNVLAQGGKEPAFRMIPSHPRLLLLAGEEDSLRKKAEGNEFLKRVHHWILAESEKMLRAPDLAYRVIGKRMLSVSREAFEQIYYLSYSYRMTGDERFARRAAEVIRTVCAFRDWHPSHFLDAAEMTAAVAIGYDWLYDRLDESTRELACRSILEKGLRQSFPETASDPRNCQWLKKKNNWNCVCNTGMAFGAIATWEKHPELSARILGRSVELVRDVALKEYLPDGNYPEGYSYWNYGTGFAVMLIDAYEKATGLPFGAEENHGFMRTPEYVLQMTAQQMSCFAYSDCPTSVGCSYPMFWFARRLNDPSLLWGEAEKIRYMNARGQEEKMFGIRYLPSLMLWAPADCLARHMEAPSELLYVGQGPTPVALMRNRWGGPDEIFVGLKGGSCSTNHAHMDNGSFVMYTGTRQWATDLGRQDYHSLERHGVTLGDRSQHSSRWAAFRLGNRSHNLITFADSLQRVDAKAGIDSYGEEPGFRYAVSDLTAVNGGAVASYRRGIAIVDDSYVVVRDEIVNTDRTMPLRWAMVTPAEAEITDTCTIRLTQDGETLYMKVEGSGFRLGTWSTAPPRHYDAPNPGTVLVGFTAEAAPDARLNYTVYLIPEKANANFLNGIPALSQWGKPCENDRKPYEPDNR